LKACGLFTGAVKKRNRFIERNGFAAGSDAAILGLIRHRAAAAFVTFAQFVHQVLEVGRQMRSLGAKVLLQPFADGIADRSAGLAIDLFAVIGASAVHGRVPHPWSFLVMLNKSRGPEMFPAVDQLGAFLVKFRLKGRRWFHLGCTEKPRL
jgi:hypothetical protein